MTDNIDNKIVILMACYNGSEFIETQIQSIISQTHTNWKLFIRDDNSTDNTRDIIHSFCEQDVRISFVEDNSNKSGACHNFSQLLNLEEAKRAKYLMFCDQDDYWFENKIEKTFAAMKKIEEANNEAILVYSDFIFADIDLKKLEKETINITSQWKRPSLSKLLAGNNIYGCTMMLNRALISEVNPVPEFAENHDYWVALVSSAVGVIHHLEEPLMKYRQHSNNVSGNYLNNTIKSRLRRLLFGVEEMRVSIRKIQKMTIELYVRHGNQLNTYNEEILNGYIRRLNNNNGISLVFYCIDKGIGRNGVLQNFLFYLLLLTMKKNDTPRVTQP